MSPERLLATSPEVLRSAGLSANKLASLVDLATKIVNGIVILDSRGLGRESDEEIIAACRRCEVSADGRRRSSSCSSSADPTSGRAETSASARGTGWRGGFPCRPPNSSNRWVTRTAPIGAWRLVLLAGNGAVRRRDGVRRSGVVGRGQGIFEHRGALRRARPGSFCLVHRRIGPAHQGASGIRRDQCRHPRLKAKAPGGAKASDHLAGCGPSRVGKQDDELVPAVTCQQILVPQHGLPLPGYAGWGGDTEEQRCCIMGRCPVSIPRSAMDDTTGDGRHQ